MSASMNMSVSTTSANTGMSGNSSKGQSAVVLTTSVGRLIGNRIRVRSAYGSCLAYCKCRLQCKHLKHHNKLYLYKNHRRSIVKYLDSIQKI